MTEILKKYIAEIIWLFLLLYLLLSISPAVLMYAGNDNAAIKVHSIYRAFCHQRVERTMFLFGEESMISFYSRDELRELGVIPEENPYVPEAHSHTIYGYPYVGNEEVGYKVALCIRDIGIYVAVVIAGGIYLLYANLTGKIKKYRWPFYVILMLPMAIDGVFQLTAEILQFPWVPEPYFASISKRIITGGLFGIGFSLLIFSNLKESGTTWYNSDNEGDYKPSELVTSQGKDQNQNAKNQKSEIRKEK